MASAPAKVILLGEHAVVYGQPALAVPVSALRASAAVTANAPGERGLQILAADLNQVLPVNIQSETLDHALVMTARLVLRHIGIENAPDVTVQVLSSIPMASGLGSGAAVSTALARALCDYFERALPVEELNALVFQVEKLYHGTPSGIDNTVIVYEQPVYFVPGQPIRRLNVGKALTLVVADTGKGALTRDAVAGVRGLYNSAPETVGALIAQIGTLVNHARDAIAAGDLHELGVLMTENHALLQELTVSSPELDTLVAAAHAAGALGAKVSGGGRGGNMIALLASEHAAHEVEEALLNAGARRVFTTIVPDK